MEPKMEALKLVFLVLSVVFSTLALTSNASADSQIDPTFYCSIRVSRIENTQRPQSDPVLDQTANSTFVDIDERPVHLASISESLETSRLYEAIPGSEVVLKKYFGAHISLLIQAYWVRKGDRRVPELQIGLYTYNKFAIDKKTLVQSAKADARGYASLNFRDSVGNNRWIEFSCRNRNYRQA